MHLFSLNDLEPIAFTLFTSSEHLAVSSVLCTGEKEEHFLGSFTGWKARPRLDVLFVCTAELSKIIKGWEATFLVRDFGLSEVLST